MKLFGQIEKFYFRYVRNYHYLAEFLNRKYKTLKIYDQ